MFDSLEPGGFAIVGAAAIRRVITDDPRGILAVVEQAYRDYHAGRSTPAQSHFLRFPRRPDSRIIALPAHLDGARPLTGIKWIASFPGNLARGLARASAVIILNDPETGYPYACLEGAQISAARTAASAALAARCLLMGAPRRIGVIGCGPIAAASLAFLAALGWTDAELVVHDIDAERAADFLERLAPPGGGQRQATTKEEAIRGSDLLILATTAAAPHIEDPSLFAHGPVVLNLSLRDLAPSIILASDNYCDDIEHCLQAGTSVHLAAQSAGHSRFIGGDIGDLLSGGLALRVPGRTSIFSPFGLGVLDLAVACHVMAGLKEGALTVPDFFAQAVPRREDAA